MTSESPSAADIRANVASIRARIDAALARAGRPAGAARLVAVAKTKPVWMIEAAIAAGASAIGENYVQEGLAKQVELESRASAIEWHLVGALQTNKAKQVVGRFALLHAVDSEKLIRELDRRAGAAGVERVDVLVEVNLAAETTKAGVAPDALPSLLETARSASRVRVRGLMAMPPPEGAAANRPRFAALASLARAMRERGLLAEDATELSIGSTDDFEAAVEEGATLVRIGTALFGPRSPKRPPVEAGVGGAA